MTYMSNDCCNNKQTSNTCCTNNVVKDNNCYNDETHVTNSKNDNCSNNETYTRILQITNTLKKMTKLPPLSQIIILKWMAWIVVLVQEQLKKH